MERTRIATYTNGQKVIEGDRIRYRQAPGGLLPASVEWMYGVAAKTPRTPEERARIQAYNTRQGYIALDLDELCLRAEVPVGGYSEETRTAYFHIFSHIVEKAD